MYNNKVVTKLINNIMLDGKKGVAQKIVYGAFARVEEKAGKPAIEVFEEAMNNIMPVLEVKARRIGGATYQVPIEVRADRRQALALRWLTMFSRKRGEKTMEERKGFGSNFGFLMAAVGSAVGLGNIWGFPNKMGASGGFTFLIIYLILAVLCGFIVMVGELAIGRKTGHGAVGAYKALSKKFKWMGWLGILSAFFILFFYCALGGYCIKYTVLNIGDLFGAGFGSNGLSGGEIFGNFLGSPAEGVIYGLIFVALTMLIVMGGIGGGIEKVCSVGMPALFVALLICIIRACTLEGTDVAVQILQADGSLVEGVVNGSALDGLKYMFSPGWAANVGYYVPAKAVVDGAEVSSFMVYGVAQAIVA